MKQLIYAYVAPDESGFQGQCFDPPFLLRADSLEQAITETSETVRTTLAAGNLYQSGFAPEPKIVIMFFLTPVKLGR